MQYVGYALLAIGGLFFIARGVLGAYLDYRAGISSVDYGEHRQD